METELPRVNIIETLIVQCIQPHGVVELLKDEGAILVALFLLHGRVARSKPQILLHLEQKPSLAL